MNCWRARPARTGSDVAGKCLVIQEARLGDLIQSAPLIDALKKEGHRPVLLVRPGIASAARSLSLADDIRTWPGFGDPGEDRPLAGRLSEARAFVGALRREGFGRAVVLNHHGTGIMLARLLGIPVAGFDRVFDRTGDGGSPPTPLSGWPGYLVASSRGIRGLNRVHLSDMWRGFGGVPGAASLPPPSHNPAGPVVVVLGGRSPYRRWEPESILALVRNLRRIDGGEIILSGSPEDAPLGDLLEREAGGGVRNMAGKTGIEGLSRLLSEAGVVVSPDTAPLHLAALRGVPTVGLFFASALFFETGAYRDGALSLVTTMECYPCAGEGADCPHRSCRNAPDPEVLACLIAGVRRGENGRTLGEAYSRRLPGVELWEAGLSESGLLQTLRTPRALTRERILARLMRRFQWRYLAMSEDLPTLESELEMESGAPSLALSDDSGNLPLSLWLQRLGEGVALYVRLREQGVEGTHRDKMIDRLASDFPMMWPLLHHLEWVEGGEGPLSPLVSASRALVQEASKISNLGGRFAGTIATNKEWVHVAI